MKYEEILTLANKFAEKQENTMLVDEFLRKFRAILNEMEGDYMTLRIKGFPKIDLVELGGIYHNLLEIFKRYDKNFSKETIDRFEYYIQNNRVFINKLENKIQKFLKNNKVKFDPNKSFSQARVHSLKLVIELFNDAKNFLSSKRNESLLNEKEEYMPFAGPDNVTKH